MDPLLNFDRRSLGTPTTFTLGANASTSSNDTGRLADSNGSSANGCSAGNTFLFRKRDGSSWITFYRSPSGKVVGLSQNKQSMGAFCPVKGLPKYLKIEHIDRARSLLQGSQIRLNGAQIEILPGLKGGMHQPEVGEGEERQQYPESPRKRTTVFISYTWGKAADGGQDAEVDAIQKHLSEEGASVIRDKDILSYRDNLETFMEHGTHGTDHTIVVLSKKYLESRNCLYELYHLMQEKDFEQRVLPVVVESEGRQILTPEGIQKLVEGWDKNIQALEKELAGKGPEEGLEKRKDLKLYQTAKERIPALLKHLKAQEQGTACNV